MHSPGVGRWLRARGSAVALILCSVAHFSRAADWPGFRGRGDSITAAADLPLRWSSTSNLAWRIDLPGTGQSSPIVWGDKVYLTSVAGARKEELVVQAIDAASGREQWRYTHRSSVPEEASETRSRSAPTPVAAAEGIYAFFESGDCFALDHQGKLRWHRVLTAEAGELASNHGLGGSLSQSAWASPIGAADRVYVFGERGATTVFATEDRFLPLATNQLGFATKVVGVAAADGAFFIRAYGELARVGPQIGQHP